MKRILLSICCLVLLLVSWAVAMTAKTDAEKQSELIEDAKAYLSDEIYVLAEPLLTEAAEYEDTYTEEAETLLKSVYLQLLDQYGYKKKYTTLLSKQMSRENATQDVFLEAAEYYLSCSDDDEAFSVLCDGIEKTGSAELIELYENTRYRYTISRVSYDNVTAFYEGMIQVESNGYWGLANSSGSLVIPCEYDRISTYSDDRAIVQKGNVISAVDSSNNRVALLHLEASNFGNYSNDRLGLKIQEGWILSTGSFTTGSNTFEEIGMYANGCVAAKQDGKWGLLNTNGSDWMIPAEYDAIICDELGRCYGQNAVFVEQNGAIQLLVDGKQVGDTYEDAKPFADGWAAVKKDGKWGFIDTTGTVQIDFQFDDALSFGQHLAAVKVEQGWGYVNLYGDVVIEPVFLEAKSFSEGNAPVLTDKGWQFISLIEYQ
jgi:hypothetical protein